jgi:hypothetical protein
VVEINIKSLVLALILGFGSWLWAFIIVGSAVYDFIANKPKPFVFEVYILMLIINAIVSIAIFIVYLWKYEQNHPIIEERWALDSIIFGAIICAMNFVFDVLFFGVFAQRDLISYFFFETTTGFFYPLIIVEMVIIAYFIYGRKR